MLRPKEVDEHAHKVRQAVLNWTTRWRMQRRERKGPCTRFCIPEIFSRAQRYCYDAIVCMVEVMVDCKCRRCEDLLCRAEEEQNETTEVFNCDQVQERTFTPLDKTKTKLTRCDGG